MSFRCDRCEEVGDVFAVTYRVSTDYRGTEPDSPVQAGEEKGHLCPDCRDEFREFLAEGTG